MTCLYCPNPLDGSDEHVILAALGGRKSSMRIVCSECNKRFGRTIDAEILNALEPFTIIINPPTRRRQNRKSLRLTDDKGNHYEMAAGGKVKARYRELEPNRWLADASDAAMLLENVQRKVEALKKRTGETIEIQSIRGEERLGPFNFTPRFDNYTAVRQMLKWALNLLGMHVLNTDTTRPEVPTLERRFVYDGINPPLSGYIEHLLIPRLYEALDHYVFVAQTPNGSIYWEASAYGGVLSIAGRTAPINTRFEPLLYHVDPVTGKQVTVSLAAPITDDICTWTPAPGPIVYQRIADASLRMTKLMNMRVGSDRLVEECIALHFPKEGVITREHIDAVARCVAERYITLSREVEDLS